MGLVARMATTLMGGVALGLLVSGVAAAIDENDAGYVTLLDRLVIGAGAPKVAVETPQAVTVVDQADIDLKQPDTVGDIFKGVPGITMVGADRPLGEGFNIRGIGSLDSPTSSGDASRIIVSVDGAPKFYEQYRMGSFFSDPELYKAVEVLRGPASATLYGSGALGGVVNFTTKDASDFIADDATGAIRLKTQYTSNGNGVMASGLIAHRLTDTIDVLATGNFRQSDLQKLANGSDLTGSEFQTWSGLVKGTVRFGENDEEAVRLSYQHWDSDADDQPYAQNGYSPNTSVFGTVDRHVIDDTVVVSYENPAATNPFLDLKASLSYSDTAVEQRDASPMIGSIGNADYSYKAVQANIENTSEFGGEGWESFLTYGGTLSYQERMAEPVGGGIITTHPGGTQTKLGLFVQDEITWDNGLTVIPGLRADFYHLDPTDLMPTPTDARDDMAISPKLAALYKVNDAVNVFGSIAHTERVPSLDEIFQYSYNRSNPSILDRTASLDLKKEIADSVEIGASTQLYDVLGGENTLTLKGTAFYNDIKDGIRSNPNYSGSNSATWYQPYFVNIAHLATWGVELEGAYESESVFGRMALTLTRGEYLEDVSSTILAGAVIDSIAQDKLALTLGGRAMDGELEFGATVTVAFEPLTELLSVEDSPFTGIANGDSTAWNTVDVFASYTPQSGVFEGTKITAAIDNLFNADYRENLSIERSKERTFKISLTKQFDY